MENWLTTLENEHKLFQEKKNKEEADLLETSTYKMKNLSELKNNEQYAFFVLSCEKSNNISSTTKGAIIKIGDFEFSSSFDKVHVTIITAPSGDVYLGGRYSEDKEQHDYYEERVSVHFDYSEDCYLIKIDYNEIVKKDKLLGLTFNEYEGKQMRDEMSFSKIDKNSFNEEICLALVKLLAFHDIKEWETFKKNQVNLSE